eukprot:scaffold39703_cov26-Tisochrysis_lutea.AAC.1
MVSSGVLPSKVFSSASGLLESLVGLVAFSPSRRRGGVEVQRGVGTISDYCNCPPDSLSY